MSDWRLNTQDPQRIEALTRYEVLDVEEEKDFKDIVKLASQICGTEISLISLLDGERHFYLAREGFAPRESPQKEHSFCVYAIMESDILEIRDASKDERFAQNPLVAKENGLRFYAGVPLRTHDGYSLGTLCVLDKQPRSLTTEQKFALQTLSKQVMNNLELRFQMKAMRYQMELLEEKNQVIEKKNEDLKEAHSQIHTMNTQLLYLNKSLEELAKERAQELDTFLYRSSHDLLRPVTSLQGLAMIAEKTVESEEAKQLFEKVATTSTHMRNLLGKLLQAHEVLNQQQDTVEITLEAAIHQAQKQVSAKHPQATWHITYEEKLAQPWITQETLVGVILANLLENVWQFRQRNRPTPPQITITLSESPTDYRLEVSDNACGMPEEVKQRAFDMFYRGSEDSQGNGLGLFLIDKAVEMMQGSVTLKSTYGEGSIFTFTLPKSVNAAPKHFSFLASSEAPAFAS